MFALGMLISVALGQTCGAPVAPAELEAALAGAEGAYAGLDEDGFRDGVTEVADLLLPCISDPLTEAQAGRTHRVMALHLLAIGDEVGAEQAAAAARRADPDTPFDPEVVPANHQVALAWAAAAPDDRARNAPEPRVGSVAFDGQNTRARPSGGPTILQLFDETGQARTTAYLGAREPLPAYRAIPRQRNMLLVCSAGSVAAAGGLYAGSWAARGSTFDRASDMSVDAASLDRGRTTANLLAGFSAVLLGAGAGCGAGAAVIGER